MKRCHRPVAVIALAWCVTAACCADLRAWTEPAPDVITEQEIESAGAGSQAQGDYFSVGSSKDDVERVQGEPDDKFFDGRWMIWYYGTDAVYFNFYDRVEGVENDSGTLKIR